MGNIDDRALTKKEIEILQLTAKGRTAKEIAAELYISMHTVKKHLQNCYRKLDATNKITALQNSGLLRK